MSSPFQDFFTTLVSEIERRQGIGPMPPGQEPVPATGDKPTAAPAPFGGQAGTGGAPQARARGRFTRRRSRGRGATILTEFLGRANVGRRSLGGR